GDGAGRHGGAGAGHLQLLDEHHRFGPGQLVPQPPHPWRSPGTRRSAARGRGDMNPTDRRRSMKRELLLLAGLALVPGSVACAQDVGDFIYMPAERLEAAATEASNAAPAPLLANTLEQRPHHASIMVRR